MQRGRFWAERAISRDKLAWNSSSCFSVSDLALSYSSASMSCSASRGRAGALRQLSKALGLTRTRRIAARGACLAQLLQVAQLRHQPRNLLLRIRA